MSTYPRYLADVNGDKKADIIGIATQGVLVSISTGFGFMEPLLWTNNFVSRPYLDTDIYSFCFGDVNADGKADAIKFGDDNIYLILSSGSSFPSYSYHYPKSFSTYYGWTSNNLTPRWVEDVNGDRQADIIGFNYTGVWVSLSNGTGFGLATLWSGWFGSSDEAGGWTSFDEYPRFAKDVNKDGKADIVGFGSAGVYIALSNGTSFGSPILIPLPYGKSEAAGSWESFETHPRLIGDITGDGFIDIIGFWNDGVRPAILANDVRAITDINLKTIKASSSECDVKCFNYCKNEENGLNCLDKCKANLCGAIEKVDIKESQVKLNGLWICILMFTILGVICFIYFQWTKKSRKSFNHDFIEESRFLIPGLSH